MHDNLSDGSGRTGPGMPPRGNAHGQAALLLTESLMHCLVAKGVISREDFVEIVEGAAEVEQELGASGASAPADYSGSLLHPLVSAFKREMGR